MKEIQYIATGVAGGAVIGKALGIGPVGILLGSFAGAVFGYLIASPAVEATWAEAESWNLTH